MIIKNELLSISSLLFLCILSIDAQAELQMIHVLSANSFYVPHYNESSDQFTPPLNDQLFYDYFIKNSVDMPNSVKMSLYNLGLFLRKNYDEFLGPYYIDEIVKTQTTQYPVSQMAALLINAGLWIPKDQQIWKDDLLWQPVPFDYKPQEEDYALLGVLCPAYDKETNDVVYRNSNEEFRSLRSINLYYNLTMRNTTMINMFRLSVENSIQLNQTHGPELDEAYDKVKRASLSSYQWLSNTTSQRKMNGGSLLKQIINDSKDLISGKMSKKRKINLYSGDDRNLMGILHLLKQNIEVSDLPKPGATLIFELLKDSDKYYIQGRYYNGIDSDSAFKDIVINNNTNLPFDEFVDTIKDDLPENEYNICYGENSASYNLSIGGLTILLYTLFTHYFNMKFNLL